MIPFILILLCIGGLILAVRLRGNRKREQEKLINAVPSIIPGFKASKFYKNAAGLGSIAIDENLKKVFMSSTMGVNSTKQLYNVVSFDDLIDVKVLFDGEPANFNEATGAIKGQVFGGGNEVVQSRRYATQNVRGVKVIILKLLLNSIEIPSFDVIFFQAPTNGYLSVNAQADVRVWMDTLLVIIRRRQSPETIAATNPVQQSPGF